MLNNARISNFNISTNPEKQSPICLTNNDKSSILNDGIKYILLFYRRTKKFIKSYNE